MSLGKFAVDAIKAWNPLSKEGYERRDTNKAYRKARKKFKRGETLTQQELEIMAQETVQITLPSGEVIERVEPTIKARTSTKVSAALGTGFVASLITLVPYYDQINALLLEACQSEKGPTVFLAGFLVAGGIAITTARLTKSPSKPGAL